MTDNSQWPTSGSTAVLPPPHAPEWVSEAPPWSESWVPPTAPGAGSGGPPPWYPSGPPPEYPSPAPHKAGRSGVAVVLIAALIAAVIGLGIGSRLGRTTAAPSIAASSTPTIGTTPTLPGTGGGTTAPSSGTSGSSAGTANAAAVTAAVTPGIVDIDTNLAYQNAAAAGTGMVLTASGEILTNNHVVEGATSISVTIPSTGHTYSATVVGTDPTEDVAVIQLKGASGLRTIPLGNSDAVTVGDSVVALGNAGGAGGAPSVVTGTIQALNQTITASDQGGANAETLNGLFETNAPIAAGDSGGPLANSNGQVIGMDTAASSGLRFNSGATQAFAIPINHALSIAKEIESGAASSTVHIGLPAFLGVAVTPDASGRGAVISGVASGTPAAAAGLTGGDVITGVSGTAITSSAGLTAALQGHHPGDKVKLTWTDQSGATHSATITLGSGPAD